MGTRGNKRKIRNACTISKIIERMFTHVDRYFADHKGDSVGAVATTRREVEAVRVGSLLRSHEQTRHI